MPNIDLDGRYSVSHYPGVAFYLLGYAYADDDAEQYEWSGIHEYNTSMVRAVMVGDDHTHLIEVNDLTPLDEDDYCPSCGQIGCGWH